MFSKLSLSNIIIILVSLIVTLFIGSYALYSYQTDKISLQREMVNISNATLHLLEKNLPHFIESYAINDYQKLLNAEMHHRDFKAIVFNDLYMAKILAQPNYLSGVVKKDDGSTVEYNHNNPLHAKTLQNCSYKDQVKLFSESSVYMGEITICSSDIHIQKILQASIIEHILIGIIITVSLIVLLTFILRKLFIKPLAKMVKTLEQHDEDGIPLNALSEHESYEFEQLTACINIMINSIQEFREREKQTIHELAQEKQRFLLAIQGANDGLWDWDLVHDELFYSKRWKSMLGYTESELDSTYETWEKHVHPDDLENAKKAIALHLEQKTETYEARFRMQRKDGSWIWILSRGKAAFDLLGKPYRMVGFHTDITQEKEHQKQLEHTAKHDMLTQLPNRFLFNELFEKMIHRARREKIGLALFYVDLDGFKEINDEFGHHMGDYVLKEVSNKMKKLLREEDVVARLGGDEFVIALANINDQADTLPLLKRLIDKINEPMLYNDITTLQVSASIGVSMYTCQRDNISSSELLREADKAMYTAKESGKNKYEFFTK